MKTAYLDCIAGASGDMLLGALIDVGLDVEWLRAELGKLPIEGWQLKVSKVDKNGFAATKVDVVVGAQPHSRPLPVIEKVVMDSSVSESVKRRAIEVMRLIAVEEAAIHGMPLEEVHLHEVSGEDAIIDIVGTLLGVEKLGLERIICSPLPLGRGFIDGAHGAIPLPAPAAVAILKGLPVTGSEIEAELVTPTGAALVKHLAVSFGGLPAMTLQSVGYGAGTWNLKIPNLLRLFVGETDAAAVDAEFVALLESNIDNENPEHYQHVMELLFNAGALDVWLVPAQMKKNRPAVVLSVLCKPADVAALTALMFRHTPTLGVRQSELRRATLQRRVMEVETTFGKVRVKIAELGGGQKKIAPEYEDCAACARSSGASIDDVSFAARAAATLQLGLVAEEG
ncbi:MAG: nickel pincer cofactor biosynthesis protein LarC [Verrucomicrobiales bacterium]|nr:nickel pincer cofactor biosynthesis protein LarC [Verrucomicrobiales bacterium]MCP5560039.1 nickel pincer cofactor biosynthesis protein LarC [Verrucomicrobiaceae bacterium]